MLETFRRKQRRYITHLDADDFGNPISYQEMVSFMQSEKENWRIALMQDVMNIYNPKPDLGR